MNMSVEETERFLKHIGWIFFYSPVMAQSLGHDNPNCTLRTYLMADHQPDTPEGQAIVFVTEFLRSTGDKNGTDRLLAKWWPHGAEAPGERLRHLVDCEPAKPKPPRFGIARICRDGCRVEVISETKRSYRVRYLESKAGRQSGANGFVKKMFVTLDAAKNAPGQLLEDLVKK